MLRSCLTSKWSLWHKNINALTESYNTGKSCVMACLDIFRKTKTLCLRGYFTQKTLFNFHLSFHRLICGMKHCLDKKNSELMFLLDI